MFSISNLVNNWGTEYVDTKIFAFQKEKSENIVFIENTALCCILHIEGYAEEI